MMYKVTYDPDHAQLLFLLLPFQIILGSVDLLYSASFVDHFCYLCFVSVMFILALWSPAGKRLTSWLSSI